MKLLLVFIASILLSLSAAGKTVNMDYYLHTLFVNKEFDKCYKLSKVVSSQNYSEYTLTPFNIKFKESMVFVSDSAKYYEYKSLKEVNPESFYYFYAIKNAEVSKYFDKEEIYPKFIAWVDSLYNSPIDDGGMAMVDNMITKKYKKIDDIPEVKAHYLKKIKLLELYKFLKTNDSISFKKIFTLDNSELITIVKNRSLVDKDLMSIPTNDFNLKTHQVNFTINVSDVEKNINQYLNHLFKTKRILTKEQICEFLYSNTNFTDEEKLFVSYFFVSKYLGYDRYGRFTNAVDIDRIIIYGKSVCNGYSLLMQYLLTKNNIENYKITTNLTKEPHANNIAILNNKVYFFDATWNIYYKEIKNMPNTIHITEWHIEPYTADYSYIKNFTYISEVINYDRDFVVNRIKILINKKGA